MHFLSNRLGVRCHRLHEVIGSLQLDPALGIGLFAAEIARDAQGGVCCDATAL